MSSPSVGTYFFLAFLLLVSVVCLVKPILVLRLLNGWGYFMQDRLGYRFTNKQTEFLKRLKESPDTLKKVDPRVFQQLEISAYIGIFIVTISLCSIFGIFGTE